MDDKIRWYHWVLLSPFLVVILPGAFLAHHAKRFGEWVESIAFLVGGMIVPVIVCFTWDHYNPTVRCDACHGRGWNYVQEGQP